MTATAVPDHGFYRLAFAAQMIVWAVRKRLHLVARGEDDSRVVEAFEIMNLGSVYKSLMAVVEVLLCRPAHRIQLHCVGCPCLPPHEIALLNAIAHLQQGDDLSARRNLATLLCAPAIRLVQDDLQRIVDDLDSRCVQLDVVDVGVELVGHVLPSRVVH